MGESRDRAARLVQLGYVSRAHGIGGDVRIERFNEASDVLFDVESFVLRPRGGTETRAFVVHGAREAGKGILARLEGVETREAAEALRGHEVLVPRSALPEPADDEVYLFDLVGLDAREGGQSLGPVTEAIHHPAADCVRVRTTKGTIEVPLIAPYLVEVDLKDGILVLAHTDDFEPEAT